MAVIRSNINDQPAGVPHASDVLLVIELADTSVALDRAVKIPLFGREGIAETWLVDLTQGTVEVYRGPSSSGYRNKQLAWATS